MKNNHPIAYTPVAHMVMLRNGHMVPLERWADRKKWPQFREPKSKKEARAWEKTMRLSVRRLNRTGSWR